MSARHLLSVDPDVIVEETHTEDSVALLTMIVMMMGVIGIVWIFKVYRSRFMHESGISILLGVIVGLILKAASKKISERALFDPELFFYILLVPIIFNAGYDLKKKHFFKNIGAIGAFAFIGTTVACFLTGYTMYFYAKWQNIDIGAVNCLEFGALISATDPVTVLAIFHDLHADVDLYALVFGESILNDAVAIVLYRSVLLFKPGLDNDPSAGSILKAVSVFVAVFVGSLCVGVVVGMVCALVLKHSTLREYPQLEAGMFVCFSYASYLLAESVGLSGIVAVLFCGMTQAHYTFYNLSDPSKKLTKDLFGLLNFLAENFIFVYLGLSLFTFQNHQWNFGFIAVAIVAMTISRAVHVLPLTWVINRFRKPSFRISPAFQAMLMWSGLRGAIAFSLAMSNTSDFPHQLVLSTTLAIIIFTVLLFGGMTSLVMEKLHIKVGVHDDGDHQYEFDDLERRDRNMQKLSQTLEQETKVGKQWLMLDNKYLKPFFRLNTVQDESCWRSWKMRHQRAVDETHVMANELLSARDDEDDEVSMVSGTLHLEERQ